MEAVHHKHQPITSVNAPSALHTYGAAVIEEWRVQQPMWFHWGLRRWEYYIFQSGTSGIADSPNALISRKILSAIKWKSSRQIHTKITIANEHFMHFFLFGNARCPGPVLGEFISPRWFVRKGKILRSFFWWIFIYFYATRRWIAHQMDPFDPTKGRFNYACWW